MNYYGKEETESNEMIEEGNDFVVGENDGRRSVDNFA